MIIIFFFFQAEDGIRDLVRSRGLGDVYKRQGINAEYGAGNHWKCPWRRLQQLRSSSDSTTMASELGIGIELLGTLLSVMGLNSMKYAAMHPVASDHTYLSYRFAGSLLLYASGQLIEVVALAFGNSAVLSACSASALVWNAILANRIFGEKFSCVDGGATFCICTGIVLCAAFGPPSHELTPDQFKENAQKVPFLAFCAGLSVNVFVCLTLIFKGMNHSAASTSGGAILYSVLTSSIGSFCYFLGSVNSQLIKHSLSTKTPPQLFQVVLIIVFVSFCVANLYFINKALARYEALVFVPVYYVLNILFTVFGCLVFYDDFDNLYPPLVKTIFFGAGVVVILIGVRVLSLREAGSTSEELPANLDDEMTSPCQLHVSRDPLGSDELLRSLSMPENSEQAKALERRRTWTVTAHTGFSGGVLLPPTSRIPSIIGSRTIVRSRAGHTRSGSGHVAPQPQGHSRLSCEDRAQSDDGVSPSLSSRRETSPV
eukprot:TRINITY_DN2877_c0_g1_i1.p1 TRINITY_DN2877_c0_g1~~TRINITY_DN2877_c0_g1_i1.p1  ORF type:complete len:486 (-),score=54.52 TRINITY_DN2877_c0_g1_i1:56-1513(-)